MILDMQYDYYGRRLATCSSDGYIHIYDLYSKNERSCITLQTQQNSANQNFQNNYNYQLHNGPIWKIDWAHPRFGTLIASCSFDKQVKIFGEKIQLNQQTSQWTNYFEREFEGSINYVQFCPQQYGLFLAFCTSTGKVFILKFKSKGFIIIHENQDSWKAHEKGINSLSWIQYSNNDKNDFSNNNYEKQICFPKLATGSCDFTIKIFSVTYKQDNDKYQYIPTLLQTLDGHKNWVRDVAWSPSFGNTYDTLASCSEDNKLIIWKLYSNNKDDMPYEKIESQTIDKFGGPVWRISWSQTGNMLAVSATGSNQDNTVSVFQENEQFQWEQVSCIEQEDDNQKI